MTLIDELVAAGRALPGEVKPVLADLQDVVAGIVDALERSKVLTAKQAQAIDTTSDTVGNLVADVAGGAAPTVTAPAPAPEEAVAPAAAEPETVGSLVADVASAAPAADPLETYTVQDLADELARRQQAAVQAAHEQRTQLVSG